MELSFVFVGNVVYKWFDVRCGMVDLYDFIVNMCIVVENLLVGMVLKCGVYCSGEFYVLMWYFCIGLYVVVMLDLIMLRWREKIILFLEGFENYLYIVVCFG